MPTLSDRPTAMQPIMSDSREPWMMRDRMSLPVASVPMMWLIVPPSCHTGGCRSASRYCSKGEWGAMTSASAATTMRPITT